MYYKFEGLKLRLILVTIIRFLSLYHEKNFFGYISKFHGYNYDL